MPARNDQKFGDIDFYQAKKRIKKRFNKLLTDLQKTVKKSPRAVEIVQQFRGCVKATEGQWDEGRLPIYSVLEFSRKPDKISCVLCLISYTAQRFWTFCSGHKKQEAEILGYLDKLENIAAKGLDAFRIAKASGYRNYYLEEIK